MFTTRVQTIMVCASDRAGPVFHHVCVQGAHVSTLPAFTFGMAHTQDISFLTESPRQQQQQAGRRAVKPLDLSRIRQNDAARGAFLGRVQMPLHAPEAGSTAAPSSVSAGGGGNLEGERSCGSRWVAKPCATLAAFRRLL